MDQFPVSRRTALAGSLSLAAASVAPATDAAVDNSAGTVFQEADAYTVGDQQGISSLRRVRLPVAEPGDDEVVVAMRAAALNYRDLLIARGQYGGTKPESRVPLGDGAGEIVAQGKAVKGHKIGDRVTAPHFISWLDGDFNPSVFAQDLGSTRDGWLAELITLPASALVRIPNRMSYADAAALGAAGITAWTVLETLGQVKPGDTVLTLGTGGVAILALQIAKMNGATVAITSSSDHKLAIARELGADITVNYRRNPQWAEAVRAATGGSGVDIVVETVGVGTLPQSLSCCAPNARVGLLGALAGNAGKPTDLSALYFGNIILKGITSGSRAMLAALLRACEANSLRPRIDRSFPYAEAIDAFDHLNAAKHVGKVVIEHPA